MSIEVDSDLNFCVSEEGADPRVFVPEISVLDIEGPNIIDDF